MLVLYKMLSIADNKFRKMCLLVILALLATGLCYSSTPEKSRDLVVQVRTIQGGDSPAVINPQRTLLLVSDIWDTHWDAVMAARTSSVIPRINDGLRSARAKGLLVAHAHADLPPPPPESSLRRYILSLPEVPLPPFPTSSSFNPPDAPFFGSPWGDMVPPTYKQTSKAKNWTKTHAALSIEDGDVWIDCENWSYAPAQLAVWNAGSRDLQEMWNLICARDIDTVIFVGGATNISALYKGFGMLQMKRLGLRVFVVRDMAFAWSDNGENDRLGTMDPAMTPDRGERQVNSWIERHFDGTFSGAELLAGLKNYNYANQILSEPGLLGYWRMNGHTGQWHVQDLQRNQGAWFDRDCAAVNFIRRGAFTPASGGTLRFRGRGALKIAPIFRSDMPPESPLGRITLGSFSIETWVQFHTTNTLQTIIAHDDGSSKTSAFELGLTRHNTLQFSMHGGECMIETKPLSTAFFGSNNWMYIVVVHDLENEKLTLYINGSLEAEMETQGIPQAPNRAIYVGGKSPRISADAEDRGFLVGCIDELAIYSHALPHSAIVQHHAIAREINVP